MQRIHIQLQHVQSCIFSSSSILCPPSVLQKLNFKALFYRLRFDLLKLLLIWKLPEAITFSSRYFFQLSLLQAKLHSCARILTTLNGACLKQVSWLSWRSASSLANLLYLILCIGMLMPSKTFSTQLLIIFC